MGKVRLHFLCEPKREPGLACAAVTGHGYQAVGGDQVEEAAQFPIAAHERCELRRQITARPENWFRHWCVDLRAAHPCSHLAARREAELVEDLFDMPFDRPLREKEPTRNITVGHPERDQLGYLLRSSRELHHLTHAAILVPAAAIRVIGRK